jgi:trehalose 6-phosphate phosphatase
MARARRMIPHLFAQWERIARRIRRSKRVVIFLDFDGTLVRVAPLPGKVRLEDGLREILGRLAARRKASLVVISGRQRAELQHYIGVRNVKYMGLYGWENNGNKKVRFPIRLALARTLVDLLKDLPSYPGVWIEPKVNSFSIHLRGAGGETRRQIRQAVSKRLRPLRETLRVMTNLRDVEVAPVAIGDKGVAVKKMLERPALRGALPIYFGDDLSDEPAFASVRKGISILVGKRRTTGARFCLRGPAEVATALSRMEEMIR